MERLNRPATALPNKVSLAEPVCGHGAIGGAKLAAAIAKLAPAEFTVKVAQISDLPLYNQDDDASQAAAVKRLKSEITASQGLLFVTPDTTGPSRIPMRRRWDSQRCSSRPRKACSTQTAASAQEAGNFFKPGSTGM